MRTCFKHFVLISCLTADGQGKAQNLVPNGSFEQYNECPQALNQMERATGWSRYRGSPDYFNRCNEALPGASPDQLLGVPLNAVGWQEPATGDAYAGVLLWSFNPFGGQSCEHFGAMLTEPLQPGVPVYVSFRISPTTEGVLEDMHWSVEGAGLRFTTAPYLQDGLAPLPNAAAVHMSYPPMDTSMWYHVSGLYVPDSAYQYVALGNFFADTLITLVVLNPNGTGESAYVYCDDVCVSYTAQDCDIGLGLPELSGDGVMSAYPVPFTDVCTVVLDRTYSTQIDLELFDHLGRSVGRSKVSPGERYTNLFTPTLPPGAYTIRATHPMGSLPPLAVIRLSPY